jgi:hypothetical protein
MLFPVIIFLWLTGWSLLWIGSQRSQNKSRKTRITAEKDTITAIISEEMEYPQAYQYEIQTQNFTVPSPLTDEETKQ